MAKTQRNVQLSRCFHDVAIVDHETEPITVGPGETVLITVDQIQEETRDCERSYTYGKGVGIFRAFQLLFGRRMASYGISAEIDLGNKGWAMLDGHRVPIRVGEPVSLAINSLPAGTRIKAIASRSDGVDTVSQVRVTVQTL